MSGAGRALAWFLRTILDAVAVLVSVYYARKYAAVARRLGLPRLATTDGRRGFVVIQVDGLSHPHLLRAMELGYAPYMQRLLHQGQFALQAWHPGLPCNTPAAQAGIMFGNNEDIPAFRWYDKATGEPVICRWPRHVRRVQERICQGRPGILRGGSSTMNTFDGDAERALFTLGAWNGQRLFERVQGVGFLLLFLLNPFRSVRTMALVLWEYLTDLVQRTQALARRQTPRPLEASFPFLRVMGNVVSREIQTFAVMVDLYRGVPAVYTTYYGYDELAHNFGPCSKPALRALRAIDARIRHIDSLRRLALTREYDLFILSDHGQTAAVPFREAYGRTLGEVVQGFVGGSVRVEESPGQGQPLQPQWLYLIEELKAIEANVGPRLAHVPRLLRRLVTERSGGPVLALDGPIATSAQSRRTDVVVLSSGSLAHLYLNVAPGQLSVSRIAALYPRLISDLVAHPGIWLVIGREGERVIVLSREGALTLGDDRHAEGADPLARLPSPRTSAEHLQRLARYAHAGDLILMGSYDAEAQVVACYEQHWSCHGGLGGPQETPFMLLPAAIGWDVSGITRATQVYPLFARRYGLAAAEPPRGTP